MTTRLGGLPFFVIDHFFQPKPCAKCKKIPTSVMAGYPTMTMAGDLVHIRYPSRCPCGGVQSICFKMPMLLLGYIMAKFTILESEKRARRSSATMRVCQKPCPWLATITQDFEAILARYKEMLPGGTTHVDQFALPMSGPEYAAFLRRCGLDEDGGVT